MVNRRTSWGRKWDSLVTCGALLAVVSCGASQENAAQGPEHALGQPGARASKDAPKGAAPVETSPDEEEVSQDAIGAKNDVPLALSGFSFKQIFDLPVTSLAVGNAPRLALLAGDPWFFDRTGWRKLPLPERFVRKPDEVEKVEIFFGRDNQPRIMGYRFTDKTQDIVSAFTPVYLRHKVTGWQKEPSELGQLGRPEGALYGILGEADPEVVCRPAQICLIKRVSGWQQSAADDAPALIEMQGSRVYKVLKETIFELEGSTWKESVRGLPPGNITSVWGDSEGVSLVAAGGGVFRRAEGTWKRETQLTHPVSKLIGGDTESLWAVGEGAPCRRQRKQWACATGKFGKLFVAAVGPMDEVFLGGTSGLWVARPDPVD